MKKPFCPKTKQKKQFKTQLAEKKNLPVRNVRNVFLYFSTAHLAAFALHNKI